MARILTVDDQPFMTRVIAGWLTRHGHIVERCANGREALAMLSLEEFDILVTDVDMPEMDGLALLRHRDITKKVRGVIVVTGRSDYRSLAYPQSPTVHVLPKPFSPTALFELIDSTLAITVPSAASCQQTTS